MGPAMVMYSMTDLQYQAVYNVLSFSLASMSATTMYLWFRASAVHDKYKSAVYISGLVTFIAAYHYIRIFNSWVDAYSYEGVFGGEGPKLTGVPFNDAYRYMDWLLTVPLLLIEILLVMKLEADDFNSRAWTLGFGSALMITSGYYGELLSLATSHQGGSAGLPPCLSSCTSSTSSSLALQPHPPPNLTQKSQKRLAQRKL